mmetsp:Transcript_59499/g.141673  ORF Transcript_59499/g.141673 Transcript_59499/m.141673 type:complete len:147 (+) Transcript_59499:99-539(+)|eukprot:CAMPEP_0178417422 /NCGR_PEP_ID=MMETSP0689_2-20121128/24565_1 /TAXON_ID=160604 /ORGANISM="Amphidinium massartii, Strain CS-259" /LENGTH=146 /DNA_ID=CAMNT_0020038785 /DNA_START=89 /DNA_END=529 /DNA_ORIENTATION=-
MSSVFAGLALLCMTVHSALGAGHTERIWCINETHHAHLHMGDGHNGHGGSHHDGHDHMTGMSNMSKDMEHDEEGDWQFMRSTPAHNPCNTPGCMPLCNATSCTPQFCDIEIETASTTGPPISGSVQAANVAAVAILAVAHFLALDV